MVGERVQCHLTIHIRGQRFTCPAPTLCRLAKEGLFDVNIQTGPCRKFLQGAMDLDHVVEVLLAERFMQEREEELHTRCAVAAAAASPQGMSS